MDELCSRALVLQEPPPGERPAARALREGRLQVCRRRLAVVKEYHQLEMEELLAKSAAVSGAQRMLEAATAAYAAVQRKYVEEQMPTYSPEDDEAGDE